MKPIEFIAMIGSSAQATAKRTGVFASITIAQAALESGWGESGLAKVGKNLFGIKADSRWRGETLILQTKEFIRGQWVVVPAKWRKYASWQESIDDHAAFLKQIRDRTARDVLERVANLYRRGHWSSRIEMEIAQSDHAKLRHLLEEIASLLSPGMAHQTPTI